MIPYVNNIVALHLLVDVISIDRLCCSKILGTALALALKALDTALAQAEDLIMIMVLSNTSISVTFLLSITGKFEAILTKDSYNLLLFFHKEKQLVACQLKERELAV